MSADAASVIADLLGRGHAVRFRATGHSMYPIIRHDDFLLVEPAKTFIRGQVVLVLAERGLTAHRVIAVKDGAVVTRGDNAPDADAAVDPGRVLGVVTHAERNGTTRRVTALAGLALRLRRLVERLR
jgi:signal peptidase I